MLFDDLNKTSQKFEKLQNSVYLMQLLPVARITLYAGSLYIYIYIIKVHCNLKGIHSKCIFL